MLYGKVPAHESTCSDSRTACITSLVLPVSINGRIAMSTIEIVVKFSEYISFGKQISSFISKERPILTIAKATARRLMRKN
jgi:hypothetical protein